jgi:hypothetical protein
MLATAATTRLKLPSFHPRQAEIAMHPARFRVAAAGRRWGKTRLGAALCVKTAADAGPGVVGCADLSRGYGRLAAHSSI